MEVRKKYRRFVCFLLLGAILALGCCGWQWIREQIPDKIQVSAAEELPDLFSGLLDRVVKEEKSESLEVSYLGSTEQHSEYELCYSLFGVIPLKAVTVSVVPRQQVYAGGNSIGIYMQTAGVLVIDTGAVKDRSGTVCCPAEHVVQRGDYIQAVNGQQVCTKEELVACICDSNGSELTLEIARKGEAVRVKVDPIENADGIYQAGIWVRNDTQGIGTLTYIKEDGSFGALGHGISDIDTGDLLEISSGTLYDAKVVSIVKGEQGIPGELTGVIRYNEGYKIGEITENQENGIYGTLTGAPALTEEAKLYKTAYRQEIQKGKASILCSVEGTPRLYDVEIKEIRMNGTDVNKGMLLEITDQELLELTGGIVQGMSGSPILQNGKIVGAVTHVLVNDPTRGYGIFIENMLEH